MFKLILIIKNIYLNFLTAIWDVTKPFSFRLQITATYKDVGSVSGWVKNQGISVFTTHIGEGRPNKI